jgi:hypothetical protein
MYRVNLIGDFHENEKQCIYISIFIYHYATNRKVAGSIPDEVILNLPKPSGRTRPWDLLSL